MSQPSNTNRPKLSEKQIYPLPPMHSCFQTNVKKDSGGHSDGAPPLPIPNRAVKPVHADGTTHVEE